MNRRFFERNVRFFNEHTAARYVLHFVYKVLPMAMFVSYPLLLLYLLLYRQEQFLRAVLVPLTSATGSRPYFTKQQRARAFRAATPRARLLSA